MNPVPVQFLFDFGSPNAYLSHKVIPSIESRTAASFEYVPILLGGLFKLTNNRSPAEAFAAVPSKRAYDQLEMRRFVDRHGLDRFRANPFFPVNTLKVMRGAVAARELGCFGPYVDAVFAAMWENALNMDDPARIESVLRSAGLDVEALLAKSQDASVKNSLQVSTAEAHARGAFGSPTFFVGEEMFFGKDRLRDVEDEIVLRSTGARRTDAP